MRTGPMNREITIEEPNASQDTYGQEVPDWQTVVTVWAEKRDPSVRQRNQEVFKGETEIAENFTSFYIHYRTGITNKMRISYDSEVYDIVYIKEIGFKEGLELATRLLDA